MTKPYCRSSNLVCVGCDERGVSLMMVMMVMLMVGALGVAALTMTGIENSMAGAMRMVEEGTDAAESCVGMGVKVLKDSIDDGKVSPSLVAPNGPVPAGNALFLGQEISFLANNPDVAWGAGAAPNITMNVNNYTVNGDIDKQYVKVRAGSQSTQADAQSAPVDVFFRIDCQAVNAATGSTSHVTAEYQCLKDGESCMQRFL
ncbi:MAG: hypothetical protein HY038_05095 [Nitrospirae bacterium]|nr:hypothetical protein [Nitrospirota bacterium]